VVDVTSTTTLTSGGALNISATNSISTSMTISPANATDLSGSQSQPATVGRYTCDFTLDTMAMYSLNGLVGMSSRAQLKDLGSNTLIVNDGVNVTASFPPPTQKSLSYSGTLPAGHYSITLSEGWAPWPSGEYAWSGSSPNFNFSVTPVPEPSAMLLIAVGAPALLARRARSRRCKRDE
jgi:hypothetical protein